MILDGPKITRSESNILPKNKKRFNFNKNKIVINKNEEEDENPNSYKSQSRKDLIALDLDIGLGKNNTGKIREYQIIKELGEGAFGSVYLVQKENTNKFYALKTLNKEFMQKMKKTEEPMIEKNILLSCKHPSIIKLFSTFQTKKKLFFVLQYAPNKDLNHLLKRMHVLPYNISKQIIAELVNVIEYLHINKNISHNDLKPSNIMLDKNYHIKLIDFSTAKIHGKIFDISIGKFVDSENFISEEANGTIDYLSPEIINHTITDYRTNDIWALGIIIYLLYNGEVPFKGKTDYLICQNIKHGIFSYINQNIPEDAKDLINNIIVLDTQKRYNIEQIKNHEFFKDINWSNLLKNKIEIEDNIINENDNINYIHIDNIEKVNNFNSEEINKKDFEFELYENNYRNEIINNFYYVKYNSYKEENKNDVENIIYDGILTQIGNKDNEIRLILHNNYNIDMVNKDNNELINKIIVNKNTLIKTLKVDEQTILIVDKYKFTSFPKEIFKWYTLISDIHFCKDN